ncbi:hypothetical protein GCM10010341_76460 [Streptomyces noursei]|nr:hypothetical protein GCM10010341_76460 [Streptomyces noursei]
MAGVLLAVAEEGEPYADLACLGRAGGLCGDGASGVRGVGGGSVGSAPAEALVRVDRNDIVSYSVVARRGEWVQP